MRLDSTDDLRGVRYDVGRGVLLGRKPLERRGRAARTELRLEQREEGKPTGEKTWRGTWSCVARRRCHEALAGRSRWRRAASLDRTPRWASAGCSRVHSSMSSGTRAWAAWD